MAKEEKKVEEVVEEKAPKKEQPTPTIPQDGKRHTKLPNGTVRTDH